MKFSILSLSALLVATEGYQTPQPPSSRRALLEKVVGGAALVSAASFGLNADVAFASGGATAGKYTTIPIAKRRYYGRVQEGVHEFVSRKLFFAMEANGCIFSR